VRFEARRFGRSGTLATAQKDTPAPAAPWSSQQNRGFLRREDYYTSNQVATKKREKRAFLLGEIDSSRNSSSPNARSGISS
jgi:hypothetical protein